MPGLHAAVRIHACAAASEPPLTRSVTALTPPGRRGALLRLACAAQAKERERMEDRLGVWTNPLLFDMLDLFDLPRGSGKGDAGKV